MSNIQNDASALFFQEQLTTVIPQVEETLYGKKIARSVIPFNRKASPGAETIKWYVIDRAGIMTLKDHPTDDLQTTKAKLKPVFYPLKIAESAIKYNIFELMNAQEANMNIDSIHVETELMAYENMVNKTAFIGQTDIGLTGLANNANVSIYGSTITFSTATSEQRVGFFAALAGQVRTLSLGEVEPDTLIIDRSEYEVMANTIYSNAGVASNMTELKALTDRLGYAPTPSNEVSALGAGGLQRAICYRSSEEILYFEETMPLTYGGVQEENNFMKIPTRAKVGGTLIKRPFGIIYGDYTKA